MTAASRPPDDTPPWIECPDCKQIVNQVASATLDLALSQHQLWACKVRKAVAPDDTPPPVKDLIRCRYCGLAWQVCADLPPTQACCPDCNHVKRAPVAPDDTPPRPDLLPHELIEVWRRDAENVPVADRGYRGPEDYRVTLLMCADQLSRALTQAATEQSWEDLRLSGGLPEAQALSSSKPPDSGGSVTDVGTPVWCSGCGHRWDRPLHGAELCGDCWRKAQDLVAALEYMKSALAKADTELEEKDKQLGAFEADLLIREQQIRSLRNGRP